MEETTREEPHTHLPLLMAELLYRAAETPSVWDSACKTLVEYMCCDEVYRIWLQSHLDDDKRHARPISQLLDKARQCARDRSGACGGRTAANESKRKTCLAILEHLERAIELSSLRVQSAKYKSAAIALDSMLRPLFICDSRLSLVHANPPGLRALQSRGWLAENDEGIHFVVRPEHNTLLDSLTTLRNGSSFLQCTSRNGMRSELHIRPLPHDHDTRNLFLVVFRDEQGNDFFEHFPVGEGNNRREGAMTPKQKELASYLLAGCNLSEAARKMNISRRTANDHLKGLFDISGTNRQPALVAWLSRRSFD